jgi:hypothetical protein
MGLTFFIVFALWVHATDLSVPLEKKPVNYEQ